MKKFIMDNLPIIVIVAGLILIGISAIGRHYYPVQDTTKQAETIVLEQKDREIKELNEKIAALQADLEASQARYEDLKTRIKQKAQEAKAIPVPKDIHETKARFRNLGYNPND